MDSIDGLEGASAGSLLDEQLIRIETPADGVRRASLPDIYAALMAGGPVEFPGLRPHQRHAWHAFLCQVGALACLRAGASAPNLTAADWRELLQALAPAAAWSLVAPADQPAFMQPPALDGTDGWTRVHAPDQLDILVTARNHEEKAARMNPADPEAWIFALTTVQTMDGYSGKGQYGISRMNGGMSNRACISVAPEGGWGPHVRRDIEELVRRRGWFLEQDEYGYQDGGHALLWLLPWDGLTSLRANDLDPYYVEVCRRLRLERTPEGALQGWRTSSKVPRVSLPAALNGITLDPWMPIETSDGTRKAITIDARGFAYERLSAILSGKSPKGGFEAAPLATIASYEPKDVGYVLVCRTLVRGQGKTEGFFERTIPIPFSRRKFFEPRGGEAMAITCQQRIEDAKNLKRALYVALMSLFQEGPDSASLDHASSRRKAEQFLDAMESRIDESFFDTVFEEVVAEDNDQRLQIRHAWIEDLRIEASRILAQAAKTTPTTIVRRYQAAARSRQAFDRSFRRSFPEHHTVLGLDQMTEQEPADAN